MKSDRSWIPTDVDLDWIDATGSSVHPVLLEMEAAAEPEGIPILDRASGRVLSTLAVGRARIVEVGTAIGYSTLCLALGQADGTIVTIDPDADRTSRARAFWRRAGVADTRIEVVNAPALEAFAATDTRLAGPFDLAFIDALKDEYLAYFEALRPRIAPGGLVVADNVLWSGRTSGGRPSRPGDGTAALREFCERVVADPGFVGTILPVGDGLLVAALRA
ncbi:MAG TPA: O-methyltransferase [Candidatus Limnocylindrales bacterium]|nr:O-methyltransferase [Candidatus Limnocylindrales bacterium]